MGKRNVLLKEGAKVALIDNNPNYTQRYYDNRIKGEVQVAFADDNGQAMYAIKWSSLKTVEVWSATLVRELTPANA